MDIAIAARGLRKTYRRGAEEIHAVDGVDFELRSGEMTAITGPSGSGKTTLLNILGCLDEPSAGELSVCGEPVFGGGRSPSERELTRLRRRMYGYIFQRFYLIPTLTVRENVLVPLSFHRAPGACASPEALLKQVGLEHRGAHLPGELSGGEMQRTAIARALVNSPRILLADEPTGSLDARRTEEIGALLRSLAAGGMAVVLVTHNPVLARAADRVVELKDGRVLR